jgi:hypothetical protein
MQMPATTLNQRSYAYDTNGVKPALVAEAESQLVDQMFDLTQLTAGSNGQRVSSQFLQALSVLVPNYDAMMSVVALRQFINTKMPADTLLNGEPFIGTLQEYYFALYEQWIQKKLAWDTDQQAEKDRLAADPGTANEKFLEWYEGVAEGRLAEIDAMMGKVLARFAPTDRDAIMGALAAGPAGASIWQATSTRWTCSRIAVHRCEDQRSSGGADGEHQPGEIVARLPNRTRIAREGRRPPQDISNAYKAESFISMSISTR